MLPGAAPLAEQIAFLLLGPPIMTGLFRRMARGWARSVQGGKVRQRIESLRRLIAMRPLAFAEAIHPRSIKPLELANKEHRVRTH